ncbi:MAG: hypothetical protein EBT08_10685, partial [Betaproteobacteria bacterium]|nr:hypothetical protein [Betaproteobacteria bacterium]
FINQEIAMKTPAPRLLTGRFVKRASAVIAIASALLMTGVQAQTLRIGLAEDPDVLDPTMARSFVGRIVFASLCDKLLDIDEKLNIVPQLASSWVWSPDNKILILKLRPGVTFHDGEKFDAAAVKFNIERHKNLAGSNRRGELAPVVSVDALDDLTAHCKQTEEDGFHEDATLQITNNVVDVLSWRLRVGRRGTCQFELPDFRQTRTHPVIELRTRDGGACRLMVWQERGRVTLAHVDCEGRCTPGIQESAWPVSFDTASGTCSVR